MHDALMHDVCEECVLIFLIFIVFGFVITVKPLNTWNSKYPSFWVLT